VPGLTLFCMNNLHELGIQRAITWIVNGWDQAAHAPVALSLHRREGALESFLDPRVRVYELDRITPPFPGFSSLTRVIAYYQLLSTLRPSTVIAVNQYEALALCLVKRLLPHFTLVVSEHCHVSSNISGADAHTGAFGWYYRHFFRREYLKYADVIHTVSHDAADDLVQCHGIPAERIRVIHNPVDMELVHARAREDGGLTARKGQRRWLLAASRLSRQKRLDILISAWGQLARDPEFAPDWRLVICGDGPERAMLERLAQDLGVADTVDFVGFQTNPWQWMHHSDLLVSTSEWEGLPCSLIEAQAVGVPVAAADCPTGPREILLDGRAGFLFPPGDVNACAAAIRRAVADPEAARQKVRTARLHLERFALADIIRQYADLGQQSSPRPARPPIQPRSIGMNHPA